MQFLESRVGPELSAWVSTALMGFCSGVLFEHPLAVIPGAVLGFVVVRTVIAQGEFL